LSIASNIINIVILIIQRYSFITTLFLGPFDDVITKFYCITVSPLRIIRHFPHLLILFRSPIRKTALNSSNDLIAPQPETTTLLKFPTCRSSLVVNTNKFSPNLNMTIISICYCCSYRIMFSNIL
jgi:hypothetical protein